VRAPSRGGSRSSSRAASPAAQREHETLSIVDRVLASAAQELPLLSAQRKGHSDAGDRASSDRHEASEASVSLGGTAPQTSARPSPLEQQEQRREEQQHKLESENLLLAEKLQQTTFAMAQAEAERQRLETALAGLSQPASAAAAAPVGYGVLLDPDMEVDDDGYEAAPSSAHPVQQQQQQQQPVEPPAQYVQQLLALQARLDEEARERERLTAEMAEFRRGAQERFQQDRAPPQLQSVNAMMMASTPSAMSVHESLEERLNTVEQKLRANEMPDLPAPQQQATESLLQFDDRAIMALQETNAALGEDKAELERMLAAARAEAHELRQQVAEHNAESTVERIVEAAATERVGMLEEDAGRREETLAATRDRLQEATERLAQASTRADTLVREAAEARAAEARAVSNAEALERTIALAKAGAEAVAEAALQAGREELGILTPAPGERPAFEPLRRAWDEVVRIGPEFALRGEALESAREALAMERRRTGELESARGTAAVLQRELEGVRGEVTALHRELEHTRNEVAAERARVEALSVELDRANEARTAAEAESAAAKADAAAELAEARASAEAEMGRMSLALVERDHETQGAFEQLSKQYEAEKARGEELETQLQKLREDHAAQREMLTLDHERQKSQLTAALAAADELRLAQARAEATAAQQLSSVQVEAARAGAAHAGEVAEARAEAARVAGELERERGRAAQLERELQQMRSGGGGGPAAAAAAAATSVPASPAPAPAQSPGEPQMGAAVETALRRELDELRGVNAHLMHENEQMASSRRTLEDLLSSSQASLAQDATSAEAAERALEERRVAERLRQEQNLRRLQQQQHEQQSMPPPPPAPVQRTPVGKTPATPGQAAATPGNVASRVDLSDRRNLLFFSFKFWQQLARVPGRSAMRASSTARRSGRHAAPPSSAGRHLSFATPARATVTAEDQVLEKLASEVSSLAQEYHAVSARG